MNIPDYDPASPEAMLYAYMDGELLPEQDEHLFRSLASQPALRSEMRELLAIRRGIRSEVLVPPVSLSTNILAAAGLPQLVATSASAGAAAASQFGWKALFSIVAKPALYTAIGSLLTFAGFGIFSQQETTISSASTTATVSSSVQEQVQTSAPQQALPHSASQAGLPEQNTLRFAQESPVREYTREHERTNTTTHYIVVVDNPEQTAPPTSTQNTTTSNTIEDKETELSTAPINQAFSATNAQVSVQGATLGVQPVESSLLPVMPVAAEYVPFAPQSNLSYYGTSLRMRSLYTLGQSIESSLKKNEDPLFDNAVFSLLFGVHSNANVGVEFGRETFMQEFEGKNSKGTLISYKQAPTLFWAGVHGEIVFNPIESLAGIQPFTGFTIAYAQGQYPMVRLQGGLNYSPSDNISFSVGYDGAALFYQYQNVNYTSLKHSLSYGISIRF